MSRETVARHHRYTFPGLVAAVAFAVLSFVPSLLPRPWFFQGLITGIDAAIGYGAGVVGAWVWRELADRGPRPASDRSWRVLGVAGGGALVVALLVGVRWQRQSSVLVATSPEHPAWSLLVLPLGVGTFVLLVSVARGLRAAYRGLAALLARRMGARAARAIGLVAVVLLGVLVLDGVVGDRLVAAVDASFAVADQTTPDAVARPTTGDRSGGPGSLVDWDELGREGRVFVGRGPDAGDIAAVTGRRALDPMRFYAGTASAESSEDRARLAVADLERAGGFDRKDLLVVTTTGSGWVEPGSVGSFEYLLGGDTATVAVQYSHLPSWLSFLVDQRQARDAGRNLFDAVYERWSALPPPRRPALHVFGESLGSFGAETAFSGEFDLANRTEGVLFVGPPHANPLYRSFVDERDRDSLEIEPVYRGGRTIRFTNRPRLPIQPVDAPWDGTRVLYLQHPTDPITWWTPDLLWHRPDWLEEPRGSDVLDATRWIPVVTFWQLSADLALGFSTQPGHGHDFTGEHVDGWYAVLRPPGWSPEQLARLRALALAESFSEPFRPGG